MKRISHRTLKAYGHQNGGGSGGNIIHLLIKTTSGEYNVYKELNIRRILQPVNRINEPAVILRLNDGSIRENFQLLRSFAVIETVKDKNGYIDSKP